MDYGFPTFINHIARPRPTFALCSGDGERREEIGGVSESFECLRVRNDCRLISKSKIERKNLERQTGIREGRSQNQKVNINEE